MQSLNSVQCDLSDLNGEFVASVMRLRSQILLSHLCCITLGNFTYSWNCDLHKWCRALRNKHNHIYLWCNFYFHRLSESCYFTIEIRITSVCMWCKSLGLEKIFLVWLVLKLRMPTIFEQQKFTIIFYVLDVLLLLSVLDYSKGLLNFFSFWSKSRNTTCCYALLFTPACLYQLVFCCCFSPDDFCSGKG